MIVGAGFGGLRTARALGRVPARVVLIDRRNYHLFQPLLYQVATAGLGPVEIAKPVRSILRGEPNLEFRMAEVERVDLAARRLETDQGPLPYDYLVLAVGAETDFFGLEDIRRHGLSLKGIEDAVGIRNHILRCFERAAQEPDEARRRALRTIAVVGGGPTGVEMAGALSELVRLVLVKDFPGLDPAAVQVILLEASPRLLLAMPEDLAREAARSLERKGVRLRFGAAVEAYDGEVVRLRSGDEIRARTLISAAGARAASLTGTLGVEQSRQGRLPVEPTLQLPGHPDAFVIGDAAYMEVEGHPLPMMAPVALQMAGCAALNIERLLRGQAPIPFRYRDPGSLATIGRNAAVAFVRGLKFKGFLAWVVWLIVHLVQLIGFRNRLLVLINWAVDYFTYDRAVRLITEE